MEIEGPLYLYERTEHHTINEYSKDDNTTNDIISDITSESREISFRLIVFNKYNPSDFKLNIPHIFYVEYQNNFVIFSSQEKENIFGFWIEKEEEAIEFYQTLVRISEAPQL